MLKHVSATAVNRQQRRGVSPAPSSTSISTLESSGSSTCSSPSESSIASSSSEHFSSSLNWRRSFSVPNSTTMEQNRTFSRLSMSENPNAVPLRVYAAILRPDIQFKTIGVTGSTTCEEVIGALLMKCKVRFKDPRLFQLVMEVDIRCSDGVTTRASIKLEDRAIPLQLQECYPKGQARFVLEMKAGTLVKIFDESNTVGWQYKSILISDKTTAGELVDILFRYTNKSIDEIHYYSLHLESKDRRRAIRWDEFVLSARDSAFGLHRPTNDEVKIVLKSFPPLLPYSLPSALFLTSSRASVYENVPTFTSSIYSHHTMTPLQIQINERLSYNLALQTTTLDRYHRRSRGRSKSLSSDSPSPLSCSSTTSSFSNSSHSSNGSEISSSPLIIETELSSTTLPSQEQTKTNNLTKMSNNVDIVPRIQIQDIVPPPSSFSTSSLTQSVLNSLSKLSSNRSKKYELSEAFFV